MYYYYYLFNKNWCQITQPNCFNINKVCCFDGVAAQAEEIPVTPTKSDKNSDKVEQSPVSTPRAPSPAADPAPPIVNGNSSPTIPDTPPVIPAANNNNITASTITTTTTTTANTTMEETPTAPPSQNLVEELYDIPPGKFPK